MHGSYQGQVQVVDTLLLHGARVDMKNNVRVFIVFLITCMSCTSPKICIAYSNTA